MKTFVKFHSPKRGVMSATQPLTNRPHEGFHSPKRGVMSATMGICYLFLFVMFHSPKRGVMSATVWLF